MSPLKEEKKFILELIDIYRSLPALWQIKSKEYNDRQKKDRAYDILLVKYREFFKDGTKDELKKKLNSLRTNFRKELKKIADSQKSEAGAEVYESTQWYFDALRFLVDQGIPAPSTSTIQLSQLDQPQEIHDDRQDSPSLEDSPSQKDNEAITKGTLNPMQDLNSVPVKRRRKSRKRVNREDELSSLACDRLKESGNEFLNLAKTWADEVSKMDSQQQIFAKKAINDVIFEGRLRNLHRNAVQINVISPGNRCSTPMSCVSAYFPRYGYGSDIRGHHSGTCYTTATDQGSNFRL